MRYLGLAGSRLLAQSHLRPGHHGLDRLGRHLIVSPGLRRRPYQALPPSGSRAFSVQPLVEASVSTAEHLFTQLHLLTGTPWYITIPLIALSINLVGRLPITLYTRSVAQRRAPLTPLLRAWYARHVKDLSSSSVQGSREELKKQADARFKATAKRVYRDWGVQRWKDFSFLGILPIWLTGIEAMRRLSGSPKGLLGTLFSSPSAPAEAPEPATGFAAPEAADNVSEAVHAAAGHASSLPGLPAPVDAGAISNLSSLADPTLATEGCLWFTDLTAPDPLHLLPFLLSAVLLWRLLPKNRFGFEVLLGTRPPPSSTPTQTFGRPLHRALMILAIMVGPATMNLPAAVHLYWVSSALITNVQSDLVNWYMKLPKTLNHFPRGKESTLIRPPPPPERSQRSK